MAVARAVARVFLVVARAVARVFCAVARADRVVCEGRNFTPLVLQSE